MPTNAIKTPIEDDFEPSPKAKEKIEQLFIKHGEFTNNHLIAGWSCSTDTFHFDFDYVSYIQYGRLNITKVIKPWYKKNQTISIKPWDELIDVIKGLDDWFKEEEKKDELSKKVTFMNLYEAEMLTELEAALQ